MQITSINILEGYHSAVKYDSKSILPQFSLLGTVKHIIAVNKRYMARAIKAMNDFRTRVLRETPLIPGLENFPYPVQLLLTTEIRQGQTMTSDGHIPSAYLFEGIQDHFEENLQNFQWKTASCDCRFYRKWHLPCSHIFHHHFANGGRTLTPKSLEYWSNVWQNQGFELYSTLKNQPTTKGTSGDYYNDRRRVMQRVQAREVTETILHSFYELERAAHSQLGPIEEPHHLDQPPPSVTPIDHPYQSLPSVTPITSITSRSLQSVTVIGYPYHLLVTAMGHY
ncbi:hypothetical protein F4861DRAFT_544487 [Xylaria intraflava]|nr:hypothetical protein F4861DRAFT_544487 [Xylaria intraflava]